MGLDITAHEFIREITEDTALKVGDPHGEHGRVVYLSEAVLNWTNKEFPGRADGLRAGPYFSANKFNFRAGSYSGYNAWRDWLATLVGFKNADEAWKSSRRDYAFYELINFADNEGYIGHTCAAKLARDFDKNRFRAIEATEATSDKIDGSYNMEQYDRWWFAFKLAAHNGCVEFH